MAEGLKLFYSYAHEDEKLRDELHQHLTAAREEGLFDEWHDRDICPGADWNKEISDHLRSSHIILLLISKDFVASDYIRGVELKTALDLRAAGRAVVIPVILRPCDWELAGLTQLQALPRDAMPITEWRDRDEAFRQVALEIKRIAREQVRDWEARGGIPRRTGRSFKSCRPSRGPIAGKLCDRIPQNGDLIQVLRQNPPVRPQVFVVCGEREDCPESLVQRFLLATIPGLEESAGGSDRRPPESPGPLYCIAAWPSEGDLPRRKWYLLSNLYGAMDASRQLDAVTLSLDPLFTLPRFRTAGGDPVRFVVVKHTLFPEGCDAVAFDLLSWYEERWRQTTVPPGSPQFIILVVVVTEPASAGFWRSLRKRLRRGESESGPVPPALLAVSRAVGEPPPGEPRLCWRLPPLRPVRRADVEQWFDLVGLTGCMGVEEQQERLDRIFPRGLLEQRMAFIEPELEKILEEFAPLSR